MKPSGRKAERYGGMFHEHASGIIKSTGIVGLIGAACVGKWGFLAVNYHFDMVKTR